MGSDSEAGLPPHPHPPLLLRSLDSLQLICSHLLHCPHYLRWSAGAPSTVYTGQMPWTSTCGELEWALAEIFCDTQMCHRTLLLPGFERAAKFRMGELIQKTIEILHCNTPHHPPWQPYNPVAWRKPERLWKEQLWCRWMPLYPWNSPEPGLCALLSLVAADKPACGAGKLFCQRF